AILAVGRPFQKERDLVAARLSRCSMALGAPSATRRQAYSTGTTPSLVGDPGMIELTVNGRTQSVDVAGDTPLLWVLRDTLGMTGTKYGCGMALCGACTVHVDGAPVRSCTIPVQSVAG